MDVLLFIKVEGLSLDYEKSFLFLFYIKFKPFISECKALITFGNGYFLIKRRGLVLR